MVKVQIRMWAALQKLGRIAIAITAATAFLHATTLHAARLQSDTTHKKTTHKSTAATHKKTTAAKSRSTHTPAHTARHATVHGRYIKSKKYHRRRPLTARERARTLKFQQAFVASSQLRPMAQQLSTLRSPAAYAGVTAYAHAHTGEAASAAWLAIGHAYLLDRKFPEALSALQNADREGTSLDDYAAYLTAQVYLQSNQLPQAETVLSSFTAKYPDSIFIPQMPVLQGNLFIAEGDPQGALTVLNAHKSEPIANRADFELAYAKANQMAGNAPIAQQYFTHVYLDFPLSIEATQARAALVSSGAIDSLSPAQRRSRADALYNRGRYSDAFEEYRSLAQNAALDDAARNGMSVAAAACQWKLHQLRHEDLDRLPDTSDEAGARRLYLYMELARDKDDTTTQQSLVTQMEARFPSSPWLAEALFSSGNMYLLRKDYPTAVRYYSDLSTRFPASCESPHTGPCSNYSPSAHWRAAWLTYRLADYAGAARMMDDQINHYPGGQEIPAALYWRARLYVDQDHNTAMAAKYYRTLTRVYRHYYYAALARQRLAALGLSDTDVPTGTATLDAMQPEEIPELSDDIPDQDPHLVKARLLANAGLNEYISPEIQAADGSDEWGSLAEAQIYASYGEAWRAMRLMKRAIPSYISAPVDAIPLAYWRILFPENYWPAIKQYSAQNGLDPYMVASLIRQESEFNPTVISYANAYGLMQLLPSVGKQLSKEEGIHHFEARDLLDPEINIRLGTLYLKQMLDKFGDQPIYAFAAYNAGDSRVTDWQNAGQYKDMDEFVESIPFTQTRDYVQAILRNEEIYKELDRARTTAAPQPSQ